MTVVRTVTVVTVVTVLKVGKHLVIKKKIYKYGDEEDEKII